MEPRPVVKHWDWRGEDRERSGIQLIVRCLMRQRVLGIPEIILIGGTRAALGAGVGLLVADKLSRDTRRGAGFALLGVGVLTTIPLVMDLISKGRDCGNP